jgi:hypothetical protein
MGLVDNAQSSFRDLPEQLIMKLVENKLEGGHADMEAKSASAGKCADARLAWKLLQQ